MNVRLYVWQRLTAALMVPLVLVPAADRSHMVFCAIGYSRSATPRSMCI